MAERHWQGRNRRESGQSHSPERRSWMSDRPGGRSHLVGGYQANGSRAVPRSRVMSLHSSLAAARNSRATDVGCKAFASPTRPRPPRRALSPQTGDTPACLLHMNVSMHPNAPARYMRLSVHAHVDRAGRAGPHKTIRDHGRSNTGGRPAPKTRRFGELRRGLPAGPCKAGPRSRERIQIERATERTLLLGHENRGFGPCPATRNENAFCAM